jgi:origin recognition complex subunit 1
LGEVLDEAKRMTKLDTSGLVVGFLLAGSGNTNTKGGVLGKGARVAGIGEAAMELTEAGVIGVELRKAERMGKVRLGIGEEDVKVAFQHDPEIKGLGFTLN